MIPAEPNTVILVVHAAALLTVLAHADARGHVRAISASSDVLSGLLDHEERYWTRSARARALRLRQKVLRRVVAAACLFGADSESSANEMLARIRDLRYSDVRGELADLLRDIYPPDPVLAAAEGASGEWMGTLRPHLIAERLVVDVLDGENDLISDLFTGLDERRATRALTVLGRAALTQPRATSILERALAADIEHLAVPALSVAIETNPAVGDMINRLVAANPLARENLQRVAWAIPAQSSVLASTAATVLECLASSEAENSQRAAWLAGLSIRRSALGQHDAALAAVDEAAGIYRSLARTEPDEFLPRLAESLTAKSLRLAALRQFKASLAAIEQAVAIRRRLAGKRDETYLPGLAQSLKIQSDRLVELGRQEESVAALSEATRIYADLAGNRPEFKPDLASWLNILSASMAGLRTEQALTAIEKAAAIRRELAQERPARFLPLLAASLNKQSNQLTAMGRREEATHAAEEAIAIYWQLAKDRPETFLPDLAESLSKQSKRLAGMGRRQGALATAGEAVRIYKALTEAQPEVFWHHLARSVADREDILAALVRRSETAATRDEAQGLGKGIAPGSDTYFPSRRSGSPS